MSPTDAATEMPVMAPTPEEQPTTMPAAMPTASVAPVGSEMPVMAPTDGENSMFFLFRLHCLCQEFAYRALNLPRKVGYGFGLWVGFGVCSELRLQNALPYTLWR